MIHVKTVVADARWSKVGSTNLNFSSLSADWEIGLVAEDMGFASKTEQLFEKDLAHAREVRPVRTGRDQKVCPEGPIGTEDRRARRSAVGSGTGSGPSSPLRVRVGLQLRAW
jgi:cardiolipin synthase